MRSFNRQFGTAHLGWLTAWAMVCLLQVHSLIGADSNPFEKAARDSYTGRFHSQDCELRLKPGEEKWTGSLYFKAKEYSIQAELKPAGLDGQFRDGDEAWPFTA